jgi:hypothetical protein
MKDPKSETHNLPTLYEADYHRHVESGTGNNHRPQHQPTRMDAIPLPAALRPLVKRLEASDTITVEEMISILFIVRLVDAMHRVAYATFLTHSFMDELRKKLSVPDLELELEVNATRWSYQQGTLMVYHRIAWDFDGDAMQVLSRIALGVLEDKITPEDGLAMIEECEDESTGFSQFTKFYRTFPGRVFVIPLLASCGGVLYFKGTSYDMAFGTLTGSMAGLIHYLCAVKPQLARVQDLLVSISTAMISTMALTLLPDKVCFTGQVLGTLFWFLYGVSFMISLYEMTSNLLITGLSRFALAILSTFILAFGVVIGVWIAAYGGPDRFEKILDQDCSMLQAKVSDYWYLVLYPIVAMGALMQMRVSVRHWGLCLVVQLVAVASQYLLETTWKQPVFVSNFLPAYLATLTAHIVIVTASRLDITQLHIPSTAYMLKHFKKVKKVKKETAPEPKKPPESVYLLNSHNVPSGASAAPQDRRQALLQSKMVESARILFIDDGWADDGLSVDGYVRNEHFQYQRSDLWFCLLPALYLLVPGSSVWRIAFFSILESTKGYADSRNSIGELISGVFVIGIGQVIGVRLGIATLWVASEIYRCCFGSSRPASTTTNPPAVTSNV